MLRRLLRVAVAGFCLLSLVACVGLGWLWWRSHRVRDAREFDYRGVRWEVASDRGRVWLDNAPQRRIERAPVDEAARRLNQARSTYIAHQSLRSPDKAAFDELLSASDRAIAADRNYTSTMTSPYGRSVTFTAPVAATALPPLLWLAAWGRRRWVLRRRTRLGLCRRCGYDLRGTPPGGRCSECGAGGEGAVRA